MVNVSLYRSYLFLGLTIFGCAISTNIQSYNVRYVQGLLSSKQLVIGGCVAITAAGVYGAYKYCIEAQKSACQDSQDGVNRDSEEVAVTSKASHEPVLQRIAPYAHEFALSFARMAGLCVAAGSGYWCFRALFFKELRKNIADFFADERKKLKHDVDTVFTSGAKQLDIATRDVLNQFFKKLNTSIDRAKKNSWVL